MASDSSKLGEARGRKQPGPKRRAGEPIGPTEVRAAVVAAAADLFGEIGVEATTLRAIAARANVQTGLIARYVGRRDDLIDAVYRQLTADLVADIRDHPLGAHSFERDSTMGRWVVMVTYFALRRGPLPACPDNPVTAIADAIAHHYAADDATARWRAAQVVGSAIGWRLFELQLMSMGDLDPERRFDIRQDLNLLHNIAGSLPLPTPDPRPRPAADG